MLAIFVGLMFFALGLWGIVTWWADVLVVLRGAIPLMLGFGGVVAIIAGLSAVRDMLENKAGANTKEEEKQIQG